jgi:hypothetical protein
MCERERPWQLHIQQSFMRLLLINDVVSIFWTLFKIHLLYSKLIHVMIA